MVQGWTTRAGLVCRGHNAGFTLIELLVTLGIAGILLSLGIPGLSGWLLDSRRSTTINELISSLNYARSEAISTRTSVSVCRSSSAGSADATCTTSGGWESGWLVFIDQDADGQRSADEKILRVHPAISAGSTLRGNTKLAESVRFSGYGATINNGRLVYCDRRGWSNESRVVIVSTAGRVRSAAPADDPNPPLRNCLR